MRGLLAISIIDSEFATSFNRIVRIPFSMSWKRSLSSFALASAALFAPFGRAANFGNVVPIAGNASDIALDESRGVLYVANFTANRIEVMSLADRSIRTSMNVAPQ